MTATTTPASTPKPSVEDRPGPDRPLLAGVDLGGLRLPNRVVMAPATRCRATNERRVPTDMHVAYYAQRATAGLIVTEANWISAAAGGGDVPGLFRADQVAAWRRVTDVVHALGGRIVAQVAHNGGHGGPAPAPATMTRADLERTVADYRAASANARHAGFDGVEVNAVGSRLLPEFLNPRCNARTDGYGGDRAGRRRLLLEVIDAVARPWAGRRVGVRLSPYWVDDRFPADDATLADYDEIVRALNDQPLAYLHLRGRDTASPAQAPDLAAIERYRRPFDGPLVANNGFDGESAAAAVRAGIADAVSFARHFIANPDLVTRVAMGRELAAGDPATYYAGGKRGYLDYPPVAW